MSVVWILVPLALFMATVAVGAFIWATKRGQFDDLETPALRVLMEDLPATQRNRRSEPSARSDPTDREERLR